MKTVKELAWLGGLFEGEASFMFHGTSPCIAISLTDKDTLEKAAALIGAKVAGPYKPKGKYSYKEVWTARIHGVTAISWMMTLYSFLGERRKAKVKEIITKWKEASSAPRAPRGTRFMSTCHPDKPRSANGLCHTCYMREYRKEL